MKERSEKTFEILEVLFRKEKVRLVFASSQLEISRQIYTDGFYYPGKKLSSKEMATLRKEAGLYKAEGYLARLLSTHRMTIRGCRDKLSRFPLSQTDREKLLSPYIEAGILDDRQYAIDFIQDRTEKGYGRTRILAELKKRGIHTEEILEDKEISLLFNIETVNAWKNIDEILGYENIDAFDAVVFGRNDFCSSIGKTADYVDSDEIFDVAENILRKIQNKKLKFFLGGNVSMSSFDFMKRLNCEKFKNFETRKITFDTRCLDKDFQKALLLALEFEFLWLNSKSFANVIDERRKYVIQQRLANVV